MALGTKPGPAREGDEFWFEPLSPELEWVLGAWGEPGRDAHGSLLVGEVERWLDREGFEDEGVREALREWFAVLDGTDAEATEEWMDELHDQRKQGGR